MEGRRPPRDCAWLEAARDACARAHKERPSASRGAPIMPKSLLWRAARGLTTLWANANAKAIATNRVAPRADPRRKGGCTSTSTR